MGAEPGIILSTSYLPPVRYFEKIAGRDKTLIEAQEHFVKQTIRNRCHILSPNGIQVLVVPIVHTDRYRIPIKDLRISNDTAWQRLHWRSLNMAYRRSAFFEFYMDELVVFYEKKFEFLLDFNMQLLEFILAHAGIKCELVQTLEYIEPDESNPDDYRQLCDTGDPVNPVKEIDYPQVFGFKKGFVNGLSFVDLLFNMGPQAMNYI
jgi:hypothetical protein